MPESHASRLAAQEIQIYCPAEWGMGITDKLHVEGASMISLSPGPNPSVAVFVAEKNVHLFPLLLCCIHSSQGASAVVQIYGLSTLSGAPTCSKIFYKADRAQIKWNDVDTQVLVLKQTEVDHSIKSYYDETSMYLLSAAGNFDCSVTLDKEGPIHDISWSPNSK